MRRPAASPTLCVDDADPVDAVPAPPRKLPEPNVVEYPAGLVLHRAHLREYAGNSFNPCQGPPTRFAPIKDRYGNCVPSLYAGSSVAAAIYETVFHDIPAGASRKTVPLGQVTARLHSALVLGRVLRLVNLREPDLNRWGLRREELVGSPPTHYSATAAWAQAVHHGFGGVHGLVWTSNQCDPDDAFLLFGDRVADTDLDVAAVRDGATDASLLTEVRQAGRRAGIRISL